MGAVETLIVWEALPIQRLIIKNPQTEEETVVFQQTERESDMTHLKHKETGIDLECIEKIPLVEWIVQNYTSFGAALEFVTNWSVCFDPVLFQCRFTAPRKGLSSKEDSAVLEDYFDIRSISKNSKKTCEGATAMMTISCEKGFPLASQNRLRILEKASLTATSAQPSFVLTDVPFPYNQPFLHCR